MFGKWIDKFSNVLNLRHDILFVAIHEMGGTTQPLLYHAEEFLQVVRAQLLFTELGRQGPSLHAAAPRGTLLSSKIEKVSLSLPFRVETNEWTGNAVRLTNTNSEQRAELSGWMSRKHARASHRMYVAVS